MAGQTKLAGLFVSLAELKPLVMKYKLPTILLFVAATAFAQTDKKLTARLQDALKGFNGVAGVYVQNLKTGKAVAINADTLFPTASIRIFHHHQKQ